MQSTERDYFTDYSILKDPYGFFEALLAEGPVYQAKNRDVLFVTGFKEALEVLSNAEAFSSANSVPGAGVPLPFEPQGDDITEQLNQHRHEIPGSDLLVTYDGPRHAATRSLLSRLFVPSRLKANEAFMHEYADTMVREVVAKGRCELISQIAAPFVTVVIADLLGVPADDREQFRKIIDAGPPPGNLAADDRPHSASVLEQLAGYFARYVHDRRGTPRQDVLTELATATYPDGTTPDLMEIVRLAVFLFAAGQDTSAKLLGNCLRFIVEDDDLQRRLRADRTLLPAFIEEVLRLEGSTKATFRVALRKTRIGDVEVPAGKRIVVALAAANRDPRRWQDPKQFQFNRERIKEHLAFGRGPHTCIGAPLARVEVRVLLDRLLEHTSWIQLSEQAHGPRGNRELSYEASFIIRGLEKLVLELTPSG